MRVVVALLVTLSIAVSSPATRAQVLHDQWFKVVVSADGSGNNPETNEAEKGKLKPIVRYARFVLDEGGGTPSYTLQAYSPTESGLWTLDGNGSVAMLDDAETFAYDASFTTSTLPLPDEEGAPNIVQISFNGSVKSKVKNEELKSAKVKSLGATAYFTNTTFAFYGKAKVTMTRVPVEKLPFEPIVMSVADTGTPEAAPLEAPATH